MESDKLTALYEELREVKNSPLEYLPKYGYSSKAEVIGLIQEDIDEIRQEERDHSYNYTPEELESERSFLCFSQGLSRYI